MPRTLHYLKYTSACILMLSCVAPAAQAAPAITPSQVPSSSDVGRIKRFDNDATPDLTPKSLEDKAAVEFNMPIPKGAEKVTFTLKKVVIEGADHLDKSYFTALYKPHVGKTISLAAAYKIAEEMTRKLRADGCFLSQAYLPSQDVTKGTLRIHVLEGYIGTVTLPENMKSNRILHEYISQLYEERPLTVHRLESFLLRINDIPGYQFRAVLTPADHPNNPAVKLALIPKREKGVGAISFDNTTSRYLGPHQLGASYSKSFLPFQQTSVSALTGLPTERLRGGSLNHKIILAPNTTLNLGFSGTASKPAYTLKQYDIESESYTASVGLGYQWIRQRQKNLAFTVDFDGRNTNSDTLNTPLTRDRVRALRFGAVGNNTDIWGGYNTYSTTISRGVRGFGANHGSDLNLSRSNVAPDFTKIEGTYSHLHQLAPTWSLFSAISGQYAWNSLYSAEEFGYGGAAFGRAYDASEITGDDGVAGAFELRYSGIEGTNPVTLVPYGFYDIGHVWNRNTGQSKQDTGSSVGLGVYAFFPHDVSGNLALAFPLSRDISAPIYGQGKNGPRALLQLSKSF